MVQFEWTSPILNYLIQFALLLFSILLLVLFRPNNFQTSQMELSILMVWLVFFCVHCVRSKLHNSLSCQNTIMCLEVGDYLLNGYDFTMLTDCIVIENKRIILVRTTAVNPFEWHQSKRVKMMPLIGTFNLYVDIIRSSSFSHCLITSTTIFESWPHHHLVIRWIHYMKLPFRKQ